MQVIYIYTYSYMHKKRIVIHIRQNKKYQYVKIRYGRISEKLKNNNHLT